MYKPPFLNELHEFIQNKLLTPKLMAITLLLTTSTLIISPSFADKSNPISTDPVQMSASYDKGYTEGVKSGTEDGYKDGYVGSYKKSYQEAYVESFQKMDKNGVGVIAFSPIHPDFIKGYKKGYQSGYKVGWKSGEIDGKAVGTKEGTVLGEKDKKKLREEMKQQCSNGHC